MADSGPRVIWFLVIILFGLGIVLLIIGMVRRQRDVLDKNADNGLIFGGAFLIVIAIIGLIWAAASKKKARKYHLIPTATNYDQGCRTPQPRGCGVPRGCAPPCPPKPRGCAPQPPVPMTMCGPVVAGPATGSSSMTRGCASSSMSRGYSAPTQMKMSRRKSNASAYAYAGSFR